MSRRSTVWVCWRWTPNFGGEKVQTQTRGVFYGVEGMLSGLNGLAYEGYEIHMGRSQQQMPALTGSRNVYGSYVHGIF